MFEGVRLRLERSRGFARVGAEGRCLSARCATKKCANGSLHPGPILPRPGSSPSALVLARLLFSFLFFRQTEAWTCRTGRATLPVTSGHGNTRTIRGYTFGPVQLCLALSLLPGTLMEVTISDFYFSFLTFFLNFDANISLHFWFQNSL